MKSIRRLIGPAIILQLGCALSVCATPQTDDAPFVVVLGVAQDAGVPQAGCKRACCTAAWLDFSRRRKVTSLAIVDPQTSERWLIDTTPDFPEQLQILNELTSSASPATINGIFLTHAHIGHYTGLMHLGREVMGAEEVPVYAMPRMRDFLRNNGPWQQLVRLRNIVLRALQNDSTIVLNARLKLTPMLVPHRDEYSETVGFRIAGPQQTVLFIPDIDKWEKWERRIADEIAGVDVAYLDGTFYAGDEIPGRNMAEIPHPFIVESLARLSSLPAKEKMKVRFIHCNHTNPVLSQESQAYGHVRALGFGFAQEREKVKL
ncbi:MBL fold metallo-hydrolase [candidate division KSB1 bacterium]|nr:MBL fold metallo-hydrolase [candidate division KSB1 bacterium]